MQSWPALLVLHLVVPEFLQSCHTWISTLLTHLPLTFLLVSLFVLELLKGHVFVSNYIKKLKPLFYKVKILSLCDGHLVLCLLRDLNCDQSSLNEAVQALHKQALCYLHCQWSYRAAFLNQCARVILEASVKFSPV